ncbi:hypothetical protein SLE2022_163310 [Rubroshorea leprosula]
MSGSLYQQTTDQGSSSFGVSEVSTSFTSRSSSSSSLAPNACISKQAMKKRLRASKKTTTIHLTANPTNFRELVQQFTGCSKTSISFKAAKGPININFAFGMKQQMDFPEHDEYASIVQPQQNQRAEQDHHHQQQQQYQLSNQEEEEFWDLSFLDNININDLSSDFVSTSCFPGSNVPDMSQGIVMEDMYFLA